MFKTLYKQTSTGAVQQWTISTDGNEVVTVFGQVDGKLQTTRDIVKKGKNIGRSNETTPEQQAALQTQQKYDGKLKKGYVIDKNLATTTRNTLAGVLPMLAHPIEKKKKYVTFPALAQPKLDGLRCMGVLKDGVITLYSRTQKEWVSIPHINKELLTLFGKYGDMTFDGELYNHKYKNDFNTITSIIKREDIHPDHELVQYHIYDVVAPGNYRTRTAGLVESLEDAKYLEAVETVDIDSQQELADYQVICVEQGFEGAMYRNINGLYEHKRSSGLLKIKDFQDEEFKIVDVEEGTGKLMGRVGAFYCELNDSSGNRFKASPAVTLEEKATMWQRRKSFIGKQATIKFQNYTPEGVPRFPIFKCVRNGKE